MPTTPATATLAAGAASGLRPVRDAARDAPAAGPGPTPDAAPNREVTVRYWAAAKAAAGVTAEHRPAGTVGSVLAAARAEHRDLEPVLAVASVLLDGRPAHDDDQVAPGSTLEVLPPFAGG